MTAFGDLIFTIYTIVSNPGSELHNFILVMLVFYIILSVLLP